MNSCEFVHFLSSLACVIAQSTNEDQLTILATFFTQLGDTLATISATKLETKTSSCSNADLDLDSDKDIDTGSDSDLDINTDTDKNANNNNTNNTEQNICQF